MYYFVEYFKTTVVYSPKCGDHEKTTVVLHLNKEFHKEAQLLDLTQWNFNINESTFSRFGMDIQLPFQIIHT